jgi:GAF domain-containing protein
MPTPREKNYLQLLLGVTKAITSNLHVDEVFRLIVEKVPEVLGVDAATIRRLDPSGRKLVPKAASGLSDTYLGRGPLDSEQSVLKALSGSPIAIVDAAGDPLIQHHEAARQERIKSLLVAPIPIRGRISGILRLLTKTPREFDSQEIELAAALAEQSGIAIQNAITYRSMREEMSARKRQETSGA